MLLYINVDRLPRGRPVFHGATVHARVFWPRLPELVKVRAPTVRVSVEPDRLTADWAPCIRDAVVKSAARPMQTPLPGVSLPVVPVPRIPVYVMAVHPVRRAVAPRPRMTASVESSHDDPSSAARRPGPLSIALVSPMATA